MDEVSLSVFFCVSHTGFLYKHKILDVAFGERVTIVANFKKIKKKKREKKGSAVPAHCFMNDVNHLSGSSPLCLIILVKKKKSP